MDFRIRQLQCFLTLANLLNYGRTARALYTSQPTVTFQIKSLEDALKVRLFERDRQQVRLTEAGFAFREYAQNIVDTVEAAREHLGGMQNRLRLRVSCGPVGQFVLLPAIIRRLAAQYPDFELEVTELTTEQQMTKLSEGKVDALLMTGPLPISGMRFDPICREGLVAIVSQEGPLAQRSSISVEDLREHGLIASRLKDCRFHQPFLRKVLAPFGITPRFVEAPYACSVQFAYAAAGEGVAIAAESMSAYTFPGAVYLPFEEPLLRMQLGLASLETNDRAAMTIFRQVVRDCAGTIFPETRERLPRRMQPQYPVSALCEGGPVAG